MKKICIGKALAARAARAGLSERQTQLVALIGQGHTLKSAAAELGISPRTVDMHSERLRAKLRVVSIVQAAFFLAGLSVQPRR